MVKQPIRVTQTEDQRRAAPVASDAHNGAVRSALLLDLTWWRELNKMEGHVIRLPAADASYLLAQARPFEPDPPSSQGTCDRCGYRGAVYAGRFGGQRCAVCFGIQTGWMPRGEL